jgi:hypothetical protein
VTQTWRDAVLLVGLFEEHVMGGRKDTGSARSES